MAESSAQPKNSRAENAFLDYVNMGPSRSLELLAGSYQSRTESVPTKQVSTLKAWSTRYHWQARIANAASERSDAILREAAELDADTFVKTSQKLNKEIAHALETDVVIKIRESVRKAVPKGGTSVSVGVNVTLTIEQRQMVERIAASRGLDVGEVMNELHGILGLTGS